MLGLRLDPDLEAGVARVARREGRTKSDVVRSALREFLGRTEADELLLSEVRTIAALTAPDELSQLDALNDDMEDLIAAEEARLAADRAA